MIDRHTGALVLPNGVVGRESTRSALLSSPLGANARCDDMHTGWIQVYLEPQTVDGAVFGITLHFEAERLDGYSLSLVDERYGTWDDYSEAKLLAQRDAHDAWLVSTIGPGTREPGPGGLELTYSFTWGKVWSTFDARAGSSSIGARFQRESPSSESPMP